MLKRFFSSLLPQKVFDKILLWNFWRYWSQDPNAFLQKSGFIKSFLTNKPCDPDGNPLPWMNYGVIAFLQERLNKDMRIFEYGSGYSTIYWAQRVGHCTSVEYDKIWYDKMNEQLSALKEVELVYRPLNDNYTAVIQEQETPFDLIIIDGRERVQCAINAFDHLKDDGILLLDDSSRDRYQAAWDFYKEKGFKQLTFTGLKPTGWNADSTTLFYRSNNCFGI